MFLLFYTPAPSLRDPFLRLLQNPQMDAQAQNRAHRIGQTKPVLIFRLLSAHTIETKIMQRATEKRQLEALVIAKGTSLSLSVPFPRTHHLLLP